jgi:glutamate-1-semialdehyde 2,1-aminomutase
MSDRYRASEELLERALRIIPLGSQTFSKSLTQFPRGASPFFLLRGQGSRVWDVDGNEYIDFASSLAAVTLGYNDADVTAAVARQLGDGVIFTLPHPLEVHVAEKIVEMVPCAEQVRFGKNGSDATAGAVRLARAYTGRERVAVCGYHGWQDWYIGSTARSRGVPASVRALTHPFEYNRPDTLEQALAAHPGEFAAVILEPMNSVYPAPGFLESVRELAHRHGALVVFDETITGFRFANGGAQELFGVIPDLATFGKGMANGYPVSAVVGRREVMQLMEDIFFSFTFGGEALSLAAAHATLAKLQREPVVRTLAERGAYLMSRLAPMVQSSGAGRFMQLSGHPAWSFLVFRDTEHSTLWELKTLFLQETLARGVITLGTHNLSFAHTQADVDRLLQVYAEVLPLMARLDGDAAVPRALCCEPLQPLFRVR